MKGLKEVKVVQRLVVGQGGTVTLDIGDESIVTVEAVGGSRIKFPCRAGSKPSITVGDDIAQLDVCIEEYQVTLKKLLE